MRRDWRPWPLRPVNQAAHRCQWPGTSGPSSIWGATSKAGRRSCQRRPGATRTGARGPSGLARPGSLRPPRAGRTRTAAARRRAARELEAEPGRLMRRATPYAACAHDAGASLSVCVDPDLGERAAGARLALSIQAHAALMRRSGHWHGRRCSGPGRGVEVHCSKAIGPTPRPRRGTQQKGLFPSHEMTSRGSGA